MSLLWVALGSALGGMARFALSSWGTKAIGGVFPWWTLSINMAGCFLIGYGASLMIPSPLRQFLIPGFCGGFTTFSAFSLETMILTRERTPLEAAAYVAASVLMCLAAVWAGAWVGRRPS